MPIKRALVVEDYDVIAHINRRVLEREGLVGDIAGTAAEGCRLAGANDYVMVMLDMELPDGHGLEVLKCVRERNERTLILVVSGMAEVDHTVAALDAGADDYIIKPYAPEALAARVRALLRRRDPSESSEISCGNLVVNRMEHSATVAGHAMRLTSKEFALLEYFVLNKGKTVPRCDMLEKVWRFDFDPGTNMVDVNVSRLREKLAALGATCHVDTKRGVGYEFTL